MRNLKIRISRFKPGVIDPPAFQTYEISPDPEWTVLDALEQIRITREPALMYRRACHHASCGTCACTINGEEKLACKTRLSDLEAPVVTLEPLRCFKRIGDLVTERRSLFRAIRPDWSYLQPDEKRNGHAVLLAGRDKSREKFENCIECGCCVSACPVARKNDSFLGPAVLSAVNREKEKNPSSEKALLAAAAKPDGEPSCRRALSCSRVCPADVYPAMHIARLRKIREGA